jgi:hypothetical protein
MSWTLLPFEIHSSRNAYQIVLQCRMNPAANAIKKKKKLKEKRKKA